MMDQQTIKNREQTFSILENSDEYLFHTIAYLMKFLIIDEKGCNSCQSFLKSIRFKDRGAALIVKNGRIISSGYDLIIKNCDNCLSVDSSTKMKKNKSFDKNTFIQNGINVAIGNSQRFRINLKESIIYTVIFPSIEEIYACIENDINTISIFNFSKPGDWNYQDMIMQRSIFDIFWNDNYENWADKENEIIHNYNKWIEGSVDPENQYKFELIKTKIAESEILLRESNIKVQIVNREIDEKNSKEHAAGQIIADMYYYIKENSKNENEIIDQDYIYSTIAYLYSLRSVDSQTQVGAAIVQNVEENIFYPEHTFLTSLGTNQFPKGLQQRHDNSLKEKVVHAEMNALYSLHRNNNEISDKTTIYSTLYACDSCLKKIWMIDFKEIKYVEKRYEKKSKLPLELKENKKLQQIIGEKFPDFLKNIVINLRKYMIEKEFSELILSDGIKIEIKKLINSFKSGSHKVYSEINDIYFLDKSLNQMKNMTLAWILIIFAYKNQKNEGNDKIRKVCEKAITSLKNGVCFKHESKCLDNDAISSFITTGEDRKNLLIKYENLKNFYYKEIFESLISCKKV